MRWKIKMNEWIGHAIYWAIILAWITSIVTCIKISAWALLFAVIFVPPVGVIHGAGVWIGAF
jgi:hypothetical protein